MIPMATSDFIIPSAFDRLLAISFALLGIYLLGTGAYDLWIDHDSMELSRGTRILASMEADETRFFVAVSYRFLLGVMFAGVAYMLHRRLQR